MYNKHIVYKATCKITGLSYIGRTSKTLEYRKKGHHRSSGPKFGYAIREHGWDNFDWEELYVTWDLNQAKIVETLLIKKYDTFKNGYNAVPGITKQLMNYFKNSGY